MGEKWMGEKWMREKWMREKWMRERSKDRGGYKDERRRATGKALL